MRALRVVVEGVVLGTFLVVSALLLFWLGREEPPAEVVAADYDDDDPGVDVDD